jgi:hypothetical protein
MHQWKDIPIIPIIELNKSTHTFHKFSKIPMYITRGYLNTLVVWLNLVPFATNGTYGHDHGWKKYYCVGWKSH